MTGIKISDLPVVEALDADDKLEISTAGAEPASKAARVSQLRGGMHDLEDVEGERQAGRALVVDPEGDSYAAYRPVAFEDGAAVVPAEEGQVEAFDTENPPEDAAGTWAFEATGPSTAELDATADWFDENTFEFIGLGDYLVDQAGGVEGLLGALISVDGGQSEPGATGVYRVEQIPFLSETSLTFELSVVDAAGFQGFEFVSGSIPSSDERFQVFVGGNPTALQVSALAGNLPAARVTGLDLDQIPGRIRSAEILGDGAPIGTVRLAAEGAGSVLDLPLDGAAVPVQSYPLLSLSGLAQSAVDFESWQAVSMPRAAELLSFIDEPGGSPRQPVISRTGSAAAIKLAEFEYTGGGMTAWRTALRVTALKQWGQVVQTVVSDLQVSDLPAQFNPSPCGRYLAVAGTRTPSSFEKTPPLQVIDLHTGQTIAGGIEFDDQVDDERRARILGWAGDGTELVYLDLRQAGGTAVTFQVLDINTGTSTQVGGSIGGSLFILPGPVDVSDDGTLLSVYFSFTGRAYVLERNGGAWSVAVDVTHADVEALLPGGAQTGSGFIRQVTTAPSGSFAFINYASTGGDTTLLRLDRADSWAATASDMAAAWSAGATNEMRALADDHVARVTSFSTVQVFKMDGSAPAVAYTASGVLAGSERLIQRAGPGCRMLVASDVAFSGESVTPALLLPGYDIELPDVTAPAGLAYYIRALQNRALNDFDISAPGGI